MLRIFFLCTLLFVGFQAAGQYPDFRNANFGMTPDEVKKIEYLPFLNEKKSTNSDHWGQTYGPEELFGHDFFVIYTFDKSASLVLGGYILAEETPDGQEGEKLYLKIKNFVSEKYGSPETVNDTSFTKAHRWINPSNKIGMISLALEPKGLYLSYCSPEFVKEILKKRKF